MGSKKQLVCCYKFYSGLTRIVGAQSGSPSFIADIMNRYAAPFLALVLTLTSSAWSRDEPQLKLPKVTLNAGMHQIQAQLATTPAQRATGLMFRAEMPANEGMLFVFDEPAVQCFWMKNTLLPLTAAFVADDGTIVNLADMTPQTLDSHCSEKPVRFVLEMNQGWFAKRAVKARARLGGKVFAPSR